MVTFAGWRIRSEVRFLWWEQVDFQSRHRAPRAGPTKKDEARGIQARRHWHDRGRLVHERTELPRGDRFRSRCESAREPKMSVRLE